MSSFKNLELMKIYPQSSRVIFQFKIISNEFIYNFQCVTNVCNIIRTEPNQSQFQSQKNVLPLVLLRVS